MLNTKKTTKIISLILFGGFILFLNIDNEISKNIKTESTFQPNYSQPPPWIFDNQNSWTEKNEELKEFLEKNKTSLKILKKLKVDTEKANKTLERIEPLIKKREQSTDLQTMIQTTKEIFGPEDYVEFFKLLTKENINKDKSGKLLEILKANINFLQTNVEQEKFHGKDTTVMENEIKKMEKTENYINKNKKAKTKSSKSKIK